MNDENQSIAANLPVGFDEKPIGNKHKFDIPEYASNEGPAMIAEAQKLPLNKRLQSNAFKNKKEAVEELLLLVKEDQIELKQYEELLPQLLSYSHYSVVDKSLKILNIYLQSGQSLSLDPKALIKIALQKCLATEKADKQDIKKSCEELLFWCMDNKCQEVLLGELNDGLINKNPKIIGSSLLFISNLLNHYGVKRMKGLERFSKHLEILSVPAKPMAKAQTIQFFKELYRWVGDNIFRDFKIHHEVKDEVARFAKDYERVPMEIKRGVKKQGNVEKKQMFSMDTEENDNQEEVDVLANFTSKWVDDVLEIPKWKDKKAALDEFIKMTRVSNILPPRQIGHFITLIKRLLSDNNINLLLCGFFIAQNLAKGLKRHFSNVAKNVVANIYAKLKDVKANIVDAAQETLKSLLNSVGLDDLLEEIKAGLDDKAPAMRVQSLKFLSNFASKKQPKIMNVLRGLVEKIGKLTEDGAEPVRKEALEFLCTLKKVHGMKYFGDKLKKIDPKKLVVIENAKPSQGQEMTEMESHTQLSHNTSMHESLKHQPTFKMQIQERMEQKEYSKETERIIVKNTKIKPEEPSVLSSVLNKPMKTVTNKVITDLISTNETVRYNAYQEIITKTNYADLKPLMYSIKSNGIKESSPNVLKLVLQIVKKYAGLDPIDMETLDYVYKHDWRRAKLLLQDFHANNKFTPEASDFIRHSNIAVSNSKPNASVPHAAAQIVTLKGFMKELEYLLTKMTNPIPQIRVEAAEHAIKFLEPITAVTNENELTTANGWNQDVINKFCGMVRFRLNQGEEVARVYSELLKLLVHKGLLTRNKGIKPILQTVIVKLKEKKPFIKQIFQQIATTNPNFLFSIILSQLIKQINEQLIQYILENNQLFIRNADHRAYICPFVHLIFNSDMAANLKSRLEKILDQIVELNGQGVLEAEVKKMKVDSTELEQYLAKYNVSLASHFPKNMNLKNDRLKLDQENPWPIFAAPTHVLKLINLLISLKEPLPLLATPFHLTRNIIQKIMEFQDPFLAEHSDILLKWVYWRTVIEPAETIFDLMKFTYKIVGALGAYISEIQYTVLLSFMINVMERFKDIHIEAIGEILRVTFEFGYMERSLLFWVNLFTSKERIANRIPVGEILQLLTSLYSTEALTHQLPTLARSPQVLKNQFFLRFLSRNFDNQFLTATGFRVIGQKQQIKAAAELKPLLSDMGGPENVIEITPEEKRYFVTLFQKCSSQQVQNQIRKINNSSQAGALMDIHMKIIYSVVVPYMKKEIAVINVFTYFRQLARLFSCPDGLRYSHCLKDLTRLLMYFLIDLDENAVDNKDEITKIVNRIILLVLEKSQSRHMLEVLIILLQYQLKQNVNTKIQHLIYKCIGKVVKFTKFQERWRDNLLYLVTETDALFHHYDLRQEHPLMRTIRSIWMNEIISNNSYFTFLDQHFKTQPIHPTLLQIFTQASTREILPEQPRAKEKSDYNPIKGITSSVNKLVALKKNEV